MESIKTEDARIRDGYVLSLRNALAKDRLLLMDLARDGASAAKLMEVVMRIQSTEARIAGAYLT